MRSTCSWDSEEYTGDNIATYMFQACHSDQHHVVMITLSIVFICPVCSQQSFNITVVSQFKGFLSFRLQTAYLIEISSFISIPKPKNMLLGDLQSEGTQCKGNA